jgi:hypothetical protein
MQKADVVLYDRLTDPNVMNLVRREAERLGGEGHVLSHTCLTWGLIVGPLRGQGHRGNCADEVLGGYSVYSRLRLRRFPGVSAAAGLGRGGKQAETKQGDNEVRCFDFHGGRLIELSSEL